MILQKGANTYLQKTNDVHIRLYWENSNVFPLCFLVDDEKIHQVIQGQEENSFMPIIHHDDGYIQYKLNLEELPQPVKKMIFAVVLERNQPAQKVGIASEKGEKIAFELDSPDQIGSLVLSEIYRYKNGWKMKAVGEAVKGGKNELMRIFQDPVKREEPIQNTPKIVTVIDSSIYSQPFFESGEMQKLFRDIYIASSIINPTREMDVYFYAVSHKRSEKATKQNFQSYIEDFYPKPNYFNVLGLENQELPVIEGLVEVFKNSETIFYLITNGHFLNPETIFETIAQSSQTGFWEIITLNEKLDLGTKFNTRNIKIVPYQTLSG
jgi:stress response protein SCP2